MSYGPPPELDSRLAALYDASCATCHEVEAAGAPLRGDTEEWDKRWAQGFDTLYEHTINSYNGMPALGGCAACSPEDLRILIQYVGGRSVIAAEGADG